MRDRRGAELRGLREAVDVLPRATRLAMLQGIARNPIIAGAYTDPAGICPMLAAHRGGGRTSFIGFARAWDAFAFRDTRHRRARRATERELLVLRTYLEASLLAEDCPERDLAAARAEHLALLSRRDAPDPDRAAQRHPSPGDSDRAAGRRCPRGGHWMRVVRRLDDFQQALATLAAENRQTTPVRDEGRAGALSTR